MTIAISMKVNDGVVLASDSASTMMGRDPSGAEGVINIYYNANKIFNLIKGKSIGAITWGSGSIGQSSISTLAKDFRDKISVEFKDKKYTVEEIAKMFKQFIYDEKYIEGFKEWKKKPALGFMIVGYSSEKPLAEEWRIDIKNGECLGPNKVRDENQIGITWNGEIEAIHRIYLGYGTLLEKVLGLNGLNKEQINKIINLCRKNLAIPMVTPAIPIQDAIELAIFLVETTIKFSKFAPGAPTVGGPIEVAAITKHESFKWVRRKHYFDVKFNPKEGN